MPNIGDIVMLRSTNEKGIVLCKKQANSNFLNIANSDYKKISINVYYILSSSAKVHGPMFQTEFHLM